MIVNRFVSGKRGISPHTIRLRIARVGKSRGVLHYEEEATVPREARSRTTRAQITKDTLAAVAQMKAPGMSIVAHPVTMIGKHGVRIRMTMRAPFRNLCSGIVAEFLVQSSFGDATLTELIKAAMHGEIANAQREAAQREAKHKPTKPKPLTPSQRRRVDKEIAAADAAFREQLRERALSGGVDPATATAFLAAMVRGDAKAKKLRNKRHATRKVRS